MEKDYFSGDTSNLNEIIHDKATFYSLKYLQFSKEKKYYVIYLQQSKFFKQEISDILEVLAMKIIPTQSLRLNLKILL